MDSAPNRQAVERLQERLAAERDHLRLLLEVTVPQVALELRDDRVLPPFGEMYAAGTDLIATDILSAAVRAEIVAKVAAGRG